MKQINNRLMLTYDESVDAAYLYLSNEESRAVDTTYSCDPQIVNGMINLDFNSGGRLIGLEVLDASKKLPVEMLSQAE